MTIEMKGLQISCSDLKLITQIVFVVQKDQEHIEKSIIYNVLDALIVNKGKKVNRINI